MLARTAPDRTCVANTIQRPHMSSQLPHQGRVPSSAAGFRPVARVGNTLTHCRTTVYVLRYSPTTDGRYCGVRRALTPLVRPVTGPEWRAWAVRASVAVNDIRFLIRLLDLRHANEALDLVTPFFTLR